MISKMINTKPRSRCLPRNKLVGVASTALLLLLLFLLLTFLNLPNRSITFEEPVQLFKSIPIIRELCLGTGVYYESEECAADLTCDSNPRTHVRQWNLCRRSREDMEADAADDESLRSQKNRQAASKDRSHEMNQAVIDGSNYACMRDGFIPTAHVTGVSHHPRLTLTLSAKFLQAAGLDEKMLRRFPSPWEMQLLVYEVRYESPETSQVSAAGEWHMLVLLDFVRPIHRHLDHIGPAIFNWNRQVYQGALQKVMAALHNSTSQPFFQCTFPDDESISTPLRVATDPPMIGGWDFVCPHSSTKISPPSARVNLKMAVTEASQIWLGTLDSSMVSPAIVPICLNCKRRVSAAYCGRLGNAVYLASLPVFIHHHAYLGIETFDIVDRYGEHHDILRPFIDSGLVLYQRHKEIALFFYQGPQPSFGRTNIPFVSEDAMSPVPQPMWYTQASDMEACRFRHFHSAKFIALWDFDEYLYFPPPSATIPQFAATCLSTRDWTFRYPSMNASAEVIPSSCEGLFNTITTKNPFTSALFSPDLETISPTVYAEHSGTSPCCRSMLSDYLVHAAITPPDFIEDSGTEEVPELPLHKLRQQLLQIHTWTYMAPTIEYASKVRDFLTAAPWNLTEAQLNSPEAQCIVHRHFKYPPMLRFPIPDEKSTVTVGKQKLLFHPTLPCSIFIHHVFECTNSSKEFHNRRPESPKQVFLLHFANQASARRSHYANIDAPRSSAAWYERMQVELEQIRKDEIPHMNAASEFVLEN